MITIGRRVYGLGAILIGVTGLILDDFAALGLPGAASLPAHQALAYACAALMIAAGAAINLPRTAPAAALVLAGYFALWLVGLNLTHAAARPMEWVSWEDVAERTAMVLGGLLACALTPGAQAARAAVIARIAPRLFGVCAVVFGVSEFVYAKFTASLVPTWLPPSQLFWTYATGAAHIAAGLAIASGIKARWAAVALTAMYLVFQLIVHLPRVIAGPSHAGAWSENGVNLLLCGAAWCLADALGRPDRRA
jgi:uncharacterized membrane protein YphA (DoxX/SURF4 family)